MTPRLAVCAVLAACLAPAARAELVKRARYPTLSPDGRTIAFAYQGDLWSVPATGGRATRLTSHAAREAQPVFSADGKSLFFSSNRFGSYDLFSMAAEGGPAKRLTHHGGSEFPASCSPDGRWVLFYGSLYGHMDVYKLPTAGGEPIKLTWDYYEREFFGSVSPDGQWIAYNHNAVPGSWRRRGYEGSANADVWIARFTTPVSEPRRLTTNAGQDFAPQFSRDGRRVFYVSDRKGQVNIWSMDLTGGNQKQHTFHTTDGVRIPSLAARADRIVYEYNSEIWLLDTASGKSAAVPVDVAVDERRNLTAERTVGGNPSEYAVSPDGRKIALIVRGDLFVVPVTGGLARRLVGRPSRESHIAWMNDSKTILFVTDEKGQKDLRSIEITGTNEKVVADSNQDEISPVVSPDGNWIAFHLGDSEITVIPAGGGPATARVKGAFPDASRQYAAHFSWAPNSKSLVFKQTGATLADAVYVADVADPQPRRVTRHFRDVGTPRWAANGRMLYFPATAVDSAHLYAVDLAEDAPPEFEEDSIERLDRPQPQAAPAAPPAIDYATVEKALRRVTATGGVQDAMLLGNGRTFIVEVGGNLQVVPADGRNAGTQPLADQAAAFELTRDGGRVFFLSGGQIQSLGLQQRDRRPTPFTATVSLDLATENRQIFQEAWWVMDRYFYSPEHNRVDWPAIKAKYEALLPFVPYKDDFYDVLAELVQELRGSHLGVTGPSEYQADTPTATAYLGLEPDWAVMDAEGKFKVARVTPGSPADSKWSRVAVGEYVLAVDGVELGTGTPLHALLDRKVGRKLVLTVNSQPIMAGSRQVAMKPVGLVQATEVEYEAWVEERRRLVNRLSGGRLAYLHIEAMDVPSEVRFKDEFVGEATDREGMVLDVRYNGGGNVAHRLLDILRKKPYVYFKPRSLGKHVLADWPLDYIWGKPAALLVNQDSASNSEMMAEGFRALGVGPVVGVPTAGAVIATGSWTFVDGGTIRTPTTGVYTAAGEDMDLKGRQPDLLVPYDPIAAREGRDPQLERAVQAVLSKLPPSQAKAQR
jgi:tricorn protease